MRGWLVLAGALLLAGCGDGEDFTIQVAMTPGAAQAEFARLDGGTLIQMSKVSGISASTSGEELVYVLPGEDENGEVRMRFEEAGPNLTRIAISVSVPARQVRVGSQQMVIDEHKVEFALRRSMQAWAKEVKSSGYASLDPINDVIGGVTIALNVDSDDEAEIAGLIAPEFMGGDAEGPQLAAADNSAEPMMNTDAGTDSAARPMDDASGDSAEGYDPNAAEFESY